MKKGQESLFQSVSESDMQLVEGGKNPLECVTNAIEKVGEIIEAVDQALGEWFIEGVKDMVGPYLP